MKNNLINDKRLMENPKPRVALVCDWLVGVGGSEREVLEIHKLFPDAPIYTSQYDSRNKVWFGDNWFANADIRVSWLQKLPKFSRKALPLLRGWYFSRLNLNEYDLVISISGAEAKFVKVKPGSIHISVCHAPTHYYWERYDQYLASPGFGKFDFIARFFLKTMIGRLRAIDYKHAQDPDYIIANSEYSKAQIKKYYGRDSIVIPPPVNLDHYKNAGLPDDQRHGFITAGRQTAYKRVDLAVEAANQLKVPLLVIGNGPEHSKLVKMADRNITFLKKVSDQDMPSKFGAAKAFIFPGQEDFGIVAVEAMAAGTPVIAYSGGGALDYVNSKNGILFKNQTVKGLVSAMETFSSHKYDHETIVASASQFSAEEFRRKFSNFIKKVTQ